MNCDEFDTQLNDVLDRRVSPHSDRDLSAHAGECNRCRSQLAGYVILADAVAWRNAPATSANLPRQVLSRYNLQRWRQTWGWAALAAALVAAAWLGIRGMQAAGNSRQGPVARNQEPLAAPKSNPVAPRPSNVVPGLGSLARSSTDRYLELARQTTRTFTEAVDSLPVAADRAPLKPSADTESSSETGSSDWTRQVASGLKPLTDSTAGAFDFLLGALPEDRPAAAADNHGGSNTTTEL